VLTSRIWWAPNNARKWQMRFNSSFKVLSLAVQESDRDFKPIDVGNNRKIFQNYDLKCVKGTLPSCFIKLSIVETYYGLDIYTHLFLKTAQVRDVPLNTTSDSYLLPKINTGTFWIWGVGGVGMEGLDRGELSLISRGKKMFIQI